VPDAAGLQAVLVNTAGGITGGDRFSLSATAGPDTHLTLTTQAAERAYGAQPGETGRLRNRLTVAQGARLDWLPQETILFENSRLRRDMQVDLAADARLLFVESLVLGRALMGEALHAVTFHDRVEIRRDGHPVFLDALALTGDANAHMTRAAEGAGALASVVFAAPEAAGLLGPVRAVLDATPTPAGASLLAPDLLHIRLLAPDSFGLRKALIPALTLLSHGPLPRTWMI
jgi:urease accessory protein